MGPELTRDESAVLECFRTLRQRKGLTMKEATEAMAERAGWEW